MKRISNWIVVLQFVALLQVALGYVGSRSLAHLDAGDSGSVYHQINDRDLRAQIHQWHRRQIDSVSNLMIGFGAVAFTLSTIAAFYARRFTTSAATATPAPAGTS